MNREEVIQYVRRIRDGTEARLSHGLASFMRQPMVDHYEAMDYVLRSMEGDCTGCENCNVYEDDDSICRDCARSYSDQYEAKEIGDKLPLLRRGKPVWYVDFDVGDIEKGTIFSAAYEGGNLIAFAVDFESGDFDEFVGDCFGVTFFDSVRKAESALLAGKGKGNNDKRLKT